MAPKFLLEIATPEKLVVSNEVSESVLPGANGEIGVLPGHAALLTEIDPGTLTYTMDGQTRRLAVGKGWAEVIATRVRVLVDSCERAEEIDTARAEAAFKRAAERLASPKEDLDLARAANALKRAEARLAAAKRN
ncbi:MAG: F0F1 ATP synthase subunit epsilon [Bryobacter sp.]|nr:F0F1 ATP synthase subunit epsilon [Bryobacter sp.]